MKLTFVFCFCFAICQSGLTQAPQIVKNMTAAGLIPNQQNQTDWVNNEWNGLFFFSTSPASIIKLCVTDGTDAGTISLADLTGTNIKVIIPAQDFVYIITNAATFSPSFSSVDYIWKSDGTTAGTSLVKTMPAVTSFSITNAWTSDRDAKRNFSVIGNTMFFGAYDAANGLELWKTDGTTSGTVLVKDIKVGTGSSNPYAFCKIGGEVFFTCTQTDVERKLWKTDGTDAGTVQIAVAEPFFILDAVVGLVNNKMIFYAHNTIDGYEPYVSDGTPAGTFMLANINPVGHSRITQSQNAHLRFNSKYCFFVANNGTANALWRTDGTSAGTIQLTTNAQAAFSGVSGGSYTDVDESGFWMIEYNAGGSGNSEKLYRSDGTPAGTYLVATNLSFAQNVKIYKNALWMASRNTGSMVNIEPWRSGGNAATTNKAFEIESGNSGSPTFSPLSSSPYGFFVKSNKLYFFASAGTPSAHNLYQYTGDFTFNGSQAGGRWSDSANWNGRMPPGITDTAYVNSGTPNTLQVDGAKAYVGVLNMGNNANINLLNTTDTLEINNAINTGLNNTIGFPGAIAFKNNQGDTVRINGGFETNNINVQSAASVLSGTVTLYDKLNFSGGKLLLNNNNFRLRINTTLTASSNNYFVTNGTGVVIAEGLGVGLSQQPKFIPIGTPTNYAPVTITNTGDADNFSARVAENSYSSYAGDMPSGQPYTTGSVKHTWFINEGTPGGSNASLTLQWNESQELPGFDRLQSYLGHYTGGNWDLGTVGNAVGLNPYTFSRTGITSFSPFGIMNNNATLPLTFISFTAQKCNSNNVCLTWKTANEQSVSHFEIERSLDGRNFSTIKGEPAKNQPLNLYSSTDDVSNITASKVYYRIKQIDADNKSTLSNIQAVSLNKTAEVTLYPNPATDVVSILGWQYVNSVQVFDVSGKLVLQPSANFSGMDISGLPKGLYTVKVIKKDGEAIHMKLIKQ